MDCREVAHLFLCVEVEYGRDLCVCGYKFLDSSLSRLMHSDFFFSSQEAAAASGCVNYTFELTLFNRNICFFFISCIHS